MSVRKRPRTIQMVEGTSTALSGPFSTLGPLRNRRVRARRIAYPFTRSARYARGQRRANIRYGGFLGIENKFKDFEVTSTALTASVAGGEKDPTPGALNAIDQGDGESQRDGRKIKMHSLHLRGQLQLNQEANVGIPQVARLAIVVDKQTNAAQMNAEDAFLDTPTGSQSPFAFRNLQNSQRFDVLYDKIYTFNRTSSAGNGTTDNDSSAVIKVFKIDITIPEKCSYVNYVGTTENVNVISDNSIHVLAWGSSTNLNIKYESRIRFSG